jgi:hypothetical protein
MLVPFVIDADSLSPDPAWTLAQQRACHKNLLEAWQRIGLLTYDGDTFTGSRLQKAVLKLPQNLRPLWQEILERVPLAACGNGWDGAVSTTNLLSFANTAQLAFVDDTRAEVEFSFGDDCDEKIQTAGNIDVSVCRLLAANQAKAFQAALAIAGTHIETGDTFQTIWETRFKLLAIAPIKRVCIVDRYAVSQHIMCPQTKLSGLERFLRLLDANATSPRHISLYSAWTADLYGKTIDDIDTDVRQVLRRLPNKNVKRLKINMVPNAGFREDSHDRFVRFEDYVWDLGLGLEVFEGAYATKRSSATFKTGTSVSGYKQVELDLANNADTKTREIN